MRSVFALIDFSWFPREACRSLRLRTWYLYSLPDQRRWSRRLIIVCDFHYAWCQDDSHYADHCVWSVELRRLLHHRLVVYICALSVNSESCGLVAYGFVSHHRRWWRARHGRLALPGPRRLQYNCLQYGKDDHLDGKCHAFLFDLLVSDFYSFFLILAMSLWSRAPTWKAVIRLNCRHDCAECSC